MTVKVVTDIGGPYCARFIVVSAICRKDEHTRFYFGGRGAHGARGQHSVGHSLRRAGFQVVSPPTALGQASGHGRPGGSYRGFELRFRAHSPSRSYTCLWRDGLRPKAAQAYRLVASFTVSFLLSVSAWYNTLTYVRWCNLKS